MKHGELGGIIQAQGVGVDQRLPGLKRVILPVENTSQRAELQEVPSRGNTFPQVRISLDFKFQ